MQDQEIKVALEIVKLLDNSIQSGPWEANLFLKGVKKSLEELRKRYVTNLGLDQISNQALSNAQPTDESALPLIEVYVLLYQAQGANLHKWLELITALVRSFTGRPIYKTEENANAAAQLNDSNPNHAYLAVKVPVDMLVVEAVDVARVDREGRHLVMLREGALKLHNIQRLVHCTGQYKLVGNFLVKI